MHLHQSPRAKGSRLRRQCPASVVNLISLQLGLRRACKTDVVKCSWNYWDMTTSLGWTGTALPCKEKLIWSQSHTASSAGSSRHRPVFNHWGQQLKLNLAVLHSIWWSCWKTLVFLFMQKKGSQCHPVTLPDRVRLEIKPKATSKPRVNFPCHTLIYS